MSSDNIQQSVDCVSVANSTSSSNDDIAVTADVTTIDPSIETPVIGVAVTDEIKNIRQTLVDFYTTHNPDKLGTIDVILEKYQGNEAQLLVHLKEKYGDDAFKSSATLCVNSIPATTTTSAATSSTTTTASTATNPILSPKHTIKHSTSISSAAASSPTATVATAATATNSFNNINVSSSISDISSKLATGLLLWGGGLTSQHNQTSSSNNTTQAQPLLSSASIESKISTDSHVYSSSIIANADETPTDTIKRLASLIDQLRSENHKQHQTAQDAHTKMDQLQRSYSNLLEKESMNSVIIKKLEETVRSSESMYRIAEEKLKVLSKHNENKHQQLLNTIALNHRLGGQVRALASQAFQSFDAKDNTNGDDDTVTASIDVTDTTTSSSSSNAATAIGNGDANVSGGNDCTAELAVARMRLEALDASNIGTRAELKVALKRNAMLEQRIGEQQTISDALQLKLTNIVNDLETASGSADSLRRQVSDANSELASNKQQLLQATAKIDQIDKELASRKQEISECKDVIAAGKAARNELIHVCAYNTKKSEKSISDLIQISYEKLLLEREDYLSRLLSSDSIEAMIKTNELQELTEEVARLRDELFKSRCADTQKYREINFLQKQLQAAAEAVSILQLQKEQYEKEHSIIDV